MNQILYVDKPKKGSSSEISKIVKIFAIIIIIFGIILISKGIYGIISNANNIENGKEPIVMVQEVEGKLKIDINHNKSIDKVIYSWNNMEEIVLQGRGQNNITETIDLPVGTNILNLRVIDSKNKEVKYTKEFFKTDKDITKPEIELVVEGSRVKIVAKDETELRYIMYKWNDEDNTVVEVREDSKKQIEEKIAILKGENTLTIIAVDSAGNETEKKQVFKGVKKPTIEVTQQNDELIIKVKDEENIQKIEINLNGKLASTDSEGTGTPLNIKEAELVQKLEAGQNNITITVYSVNGLSEQITKNITI